MPRALLQDGPAAALGSAIFAQSDFATDADGWTVQTGYPLSTASAAPAWQASAPSFPRGVVAWQAQADAAQSSDVFLKAPVKFLGDLSGCYGQTFDLVLSTLTPPDQTPAGFYAGAQGLILQSAVGDLWIPSNVQNSIQDPTLAPVQALAVGLFETAACRLSSTGAAPSADEFKSVLHAVTGLLVRLSWFEGSVDWTTTVGAVALYKTGSLDPRLAALQSRLQAAIVGDALILGAETLGADGAALLAQLHSQLSIDALHVSGHVAITAIDDGLLVTADSFDDTVLGVSGNGVSIAFGQTPQALTWQIVLQCGAGWSVADSFPNLGGTWAGGVAVVAEADADALLILASQAGPRTGEPSAPALLEGLNLIAKLDVAAGPALALSQLIPGLAGPLQAAGLALNTARGEQLDLQASLPAFTLALPVLPAL
ncbi:MAG: hypothetical protein VX755_10370, partial [Pseudomonadota bacterium]|nr:hypothetical protein [Pseudomonadota bacterium]